MSRAWDSKTFWIDGLLQRGVVRSLEIIGEASKNVSPELNAAHPEVEWKMMAAMRDKLIHHYFQVNWMIVWNVLTGGATSVKGSY